MMLTKVEEQEIIEQEQKLHDDIEILQRRIEGINDTLQRIAVCKTEGHEWPERSPDYYFCNRCGAYLG